MDLDGFGHDGHSLMVKDSSQLEVPLFRLFRLSFKLTLIGKGALKPETHRDPIGKIMYHQLAGSL